MLPMLFMQLQDVFLLKFASMELSMQKSQAWMHSHKQFTILEDGGHSLQEVRQ
jgi:hypothetical protein